MAMCKVAVVGAGIIGLSSAVCIQEAWPQCHATLVSETFSPNTTSDGSGGLWFPFYVNTTDATLVEETGKVTYEYLKQLGFSALAGKLGVNLLTVYQLNEAEKNEDDVIPYVDGFRWLSQQELQRFPLARSGYCLSSMTVDVTSYMKWLMMRYKKNGGRVKCQKLNNLSQLSGQYDVIINCCGMGSAELLNDQEMVPIRGQVMRMEAPWVKETYAFNPKNGPTTYLIPGSRNVVVGGTVGKGDWDTIAHAQTDDDIWERAVQAFPLIAHAKKIKSWTGLRPGRSCVRLEVETMKLNGQTIPVIHNYGHGGSGVTLHWGCALKVVSMLRDILPPRTIALKHKL